MGEFKDYFKNHYEIYQGTADLYAYFIERAISLLKNGGLFSYIVANKWMRANYGEALRRWIKTQRIEEIIDFGDLPVFEGATAYPCIIRIKKEARTIPPLAKGGKGGFSFPVTKVSTLHFENLINYVKENSFPVVRASLDDKGWSLVNEETQLLMNKIRALGIPLGDYVKGKIYRGVLTGLNEAFVIDEKTKDKLIAEDPKSAELIKPFLVGKDIKRYGSSPKGRYLILIPKCWTKDQNRHSRENGNPGTTGFRIKSGMTETGAWKWFSEAYPAIAVHLESYAERGKKRYDKGEYWWELRACDYYEEFKKPKIILPDISLRGNFTFDTEGLYCANTAYIIVNADKYLLGILNSQLIHFIYKGMSASYRGGYLRFIQQYIATTPHPPHRLQQSFRKNHP